MKRFYIHFNWVLFIIISLSTSCEDVGERAIDTKSVAQEVKDRKPKRVTESDLVKWVDIKGQEITRITQKHLFRAVLKALEEKKMESPADFEQLPKVSQIDSLAKAYQVNLKTFSLKNKPNEKTQTIENQIFSQFQKSESEWNSQVKIEPKSQEILFHNPIVFDNELVGMWVIYFPRQQAIRFFDYKELITK